ncbi:MAG: hypothetical protein K1W22_11175 [Lachnospiraceae bacterium]
MDKITRHPLYQTADIIKRAFLVNGFHLYDNGNSPEVVSADKTVELYALPEEAVLRPVMLEEGRYVLRTSLLPTEISRMKGRFPVKELICGRVYHAEDKELPGHMYLEGVFADRDIAAKDWEVLLDRASKEIYGISAKSVLEPVKKDMFRIVIRKDDGSEVTLGYTGYGNWLARALLGVEDEEIKVWLLTIDVDSVAMDLHHKESREVLYENLMATLKMCETEVPVCGDTLADQVSNILREKGYTEYIGSRIYQADAYIKMNMFQGEWDTNNKGMMLVEPLGKDGGNIWLPTVLTPGLEEVIAENYKAGEETVKIFDIGHVYLPGRDGKEPTEKIALSIGAYGPEIDAKSFKADMDELLSRLGISNHFFIPTDIPIPYDKKHCWLVMDENMSYLEGNFGGIGEKARENYGIGVLAYMANFEIEPLEKKAASEYYFVPPELE